MRHPRFAVAAAAVVVFAAVVTARATAPAATPAEATAFIEQAESRLLSLWIDAERASWVYATFITDDTEAIQAQARRKVIDETVKLSKEAQRFKGLKLPKDVARKFALLPISLSLVAPSDPVKSKELSELAAQMEGIYGKGKYCPAGKGRSHAVIAPTRENASEGVIHPNVCRGRPLSSAAIASSCAWLYTARSVPLGKY